MYDKEEKQVKILFAIRVVLWAVALGSTVYWIWYSFDLMGNGVFDPYEYASLLRPVLYPCVCVAVVAVGICFALYKRSKELKKVILQKKKEEDINK